LIVAAFSAIAAATLRRRPYLAVGWFWFVVMLLPVSGVIPVGLQLMADRYTYLPGIGLGLVLAWGAADLAATLRFGRTSWYLATAAIGTLLVACAAGTRDQLAYWKDTETLMGRALEIDPNNYIAHENLGVYYLKLGRTEAARAHRQRACELDPARRQTRPAEAVPRIRAK
jgi:tetratricopeptide (TPR) repeat protein